MACMSAWPRTRKFKGLRRRELRNLIQIGPGRKEFVIASDDKAFELAALRPGPQLFDGAV